MKKDLSIQEMFANLKVEITIKNKEFEKKNKEFEKKNEELEEQNDEIKKLRENQEARDKKIEQLIAETRSLIRNYKSPYWQVQAYLQFFFLKI